MNLQAIKKEVENTRFTLKECSKHHNFFLKIVEKLDMYIEVMEAREEIKKGNSLLGIMNKLLENETKRKK